VDELGRGQFHAPLVFLRNPPHPILHVVNGLFVVHEHLDPTFWNGFVENTFSNQTRQLPYTKRKEIKIQLV
jgi:hypothetical protein